ncbi:MAG: endonuclease III [Candidatus Micrarchaeota archaeon]|nr:endonuclease III [Candidatus Micrarchaeota archaeon]MCX8154709.1 endonuclease III [Candidatus Micrarchaeota archaeon]
MNFREIIDLIESAKLDSPVYRIKRYLDTKEKKFVYVFLSTRTRDEVTLDATERFYREYGSIWNIDNPEHVAQVIKPVAFYRVKANNLYRISVEYKDIPETLDELLEMPGVGIKVAKVFLAEMGYDYVGVDTHVHRIVNRIGIIHTDNPRDTDIILNRIVPKSLRRHVNVHLVALGQTICRARSPRCEICPIQRHCRYFLNRS